VRAAMARQSACLRLAGMRAIAMGVGNGLWGAGAQRAAAAAPPPAATLWHRGQLLAAASSPCWQCCAGSHIFRAWMRTVSALAGAIIHGWGAGRAQGRHEDSSIVLPTVQRCAVAWRARRSAAAHSHPQGSGHGEARCAVAPAAGVGDRGCAAAARGRMLAAAASWQLQDGSQHGAHLRCDCGPSACHRAPPRAGTLGGCQTPRRCRGRRRQGRGGRGGVRGLPTERQQIQRWPASSPARHAGSPGPAAHPGRWRVACQSQRGWGCCGLAACSGRTKRSRRNGTVLQPASPGWRDPHGDDGVGHHLCPRLGWPQLGGERPGILRGDPRSCSRGADGLPLHDRWGLGLVRHQGHRPHA